MKNATRLLHFDGSDHDIWRVETPSEGIIQIRHEWSKEAPRLLMLFDAGANPEAIIAGDFKSHRVNAPGWPAPGRAGEVDAQLLDVAPQNKPSLSYFNLSLKVGPKKFPPFRYVAVRVGKRCIALLDAPSAQQEPSSPNNFFVRFNRSDMTVFLRGLRPGLDEVWVKQNKRDCHFDSKALMDFYNEKT